MIKSLKIAIGDIIMNSAYWVADKSNNGMFIWYWCFLLYKYFLNLFGMKILQIVSIDDFLKFENHNDRTIVKNNRKGISVCSSAPFEMEANNYYKELKDLCISRLHNVFITSGTDIIVNDSLNWIISDFCVNKSNNIYCSDNLLYREKNNWGLLRKVIKKQPQVIDAGIMICGKYPNNYYHCLFENLNRCLLIDDSIIPKEVPIIVDKVVLSIPSLEKIVRFLICGNQRKMLPVETSELYLCKNLYYIDHLNYIIPHHKKLSVLPDERSYYDPELLLLQRSTLLKYRKGRQLPTRVFITRSKSASRNYNEEEVFGILKEWGFEKVAPEKLSFEEQIELFYNADYIVGGTGAAFSNILFCQPKCKILCFRPVQSSEGTPLFKSISKINGSDFWHYKPDRIYKDSVHSNYFISPSRLKETLTKLWGLNK